MSRSGRRRCARGPRSRVRRPRPRRGPRAAPHPARAGGRAPRTRPRCRWATRNRAKSRRGRSWPAETKTRALDVLRETGSLRLAEGVTGVPDSTLCRWAASAGIDVRDHAARTAAATDVRVAETRATAVAGISDTLETNVDVLRTLSRNELEAARIVELTRADGVTWDARLGEYVPANPAAREALTVGTSPPRVRSTSSRSASSSATLALLARCRGTVARVAAPWPSLASTAAGGVVIHVGLARHGTADASILARVDP